MIMSPLTITAPQRGALRSKQRTERERANAGRPESLERRCVLAPRIEQHVEAPRVTLTLTNARRLKQVKHGLAVAIHEERKRHDEALQERRRLRCTHAHQHRVQEVRNTGRTPSPARRKRCMMRSPITSPPDSSWFCSRRAMTVKTCRRPDWPSACVHDRSCPTSLRTTSVRSRTPFCFFLVENGVKTGAKKVRARTCKTSRSSATLRQSNTHGAMAAKNPSPKPASGAPRATLPRSSSAEEATHDSFGLAFPIDAVSLGNACFTIVSYTPGTFALAIECNTSLRIDKKIGSVK
jgi:hypothetical protein